MANLNATLVYDVLQQATTGENRALIEATPALSWMLGELDDHRDTLGELLGGRPEDETVDELRARAREVDADFDRAHRFLHHLLMAGEYLDDPGLAAAVARARGILYPEGLRIVNQTWRQAAASTAVFKNQLERRDVMAGLEAAGAYIKRLKSVIKDCVKAGEALSEIVRRLDEGEARAEALPADRALFEARRAAVISWSVFVSNVQHAFAGEDPDAVEARHQLLHRWTTLREELAREAASTAPEAPGEDEA